MISAFPAKPSRTASPEVFDQQMDDFLAHFAVFVDETNAESTAIEADRLAAEGAAATATNKAGEAANSAAAADADRVAAEAAAGTATSKAGEASASAATATTKAGEASASAATATTKAAEAAASAASINPASIAITGGRIGGITASGNWTPEDGWGLVGDRDGPIAILNNAGRPNYFEFSKSGYTERGAIGALGAFEMNVSFNMDYKLGIHRLYNTAKSAIWTAMNEAGYFLQYAPATVAAGDVWAAGGNLYNHVIDNATGNHTMRGSVSAAGLSSTATLSVTGQSTFASNIHIGNAAPLSAARCYIKGETTDGTKYGLYVVDSAGTERLTQKNDGTTEVGGILTPSTDNVRTLGSASKRWSTVYAGTGTISTSDGRSKTAVSPMSAAEISAAKQLSMEIGVYRFLAAIQEKGDGARLHIGMTVQRAIEIMQANGLDPFAYGFICHDAWGDEFFTHPAVYKDVEVPAVYRHHDAETVTHPATVIHHPATETLLPALIEIDGVKKEITFINRQPSWDEDVPERIEITKPAWVELVEPARVDRILVSEERTVQTQFAGDRFSFRYDELAMFILAGMESRLADLETA